VVWLHAAAASQRYIRSDLLQEIDQRTSYALHD
jgi:hypothetical protein